MHNTCSYKIQINLCISIYTCLSDSLFLLCHSAGMTPVHPGEGQPVYHDEPGAFFLKNKVRSHSADIVPV